jgi:hypothetical protein
MKAMSLLHQAMRAVLYCRIATAIEMASKRGWGVLLIFVLFVTLAAAGALRSK